MILCALESLDSKLSNAPNIISRSAIDKSVNWGWSDIGANLLTTWNFTDWNSEILSFPTSPKSLRSEHSKSVKLRVKDSRIRWRSSRMIWVICYWSIPLTWHGLANSTWVKKSKMLKMILVKFHHVEFTPPCKIHTYIHTYRLMVITLSVW